MNQRTPAAQSAVVGTRGSERPVCCCAASGTLSLLLWKCRDSCPLSTWACIIHRFSAHHAGCHAWWEHERKHRATCNCVFLFPTYVVCRRRMQLATATSNYRWLCLCKFPEHNQAHTWSAFHVRILVSAESLTIRKWDGESCSCWECMQYWCSSLGGIISVMLLRCVLDHSLWISLWAFLIDLVRVLPTRN